MFIGWYSKKYDCNKHKKVIFADFDPFLHLTPSNRHFLAIFTTFRCTFCQKGLNMLALSMLALSVLLLSALALELFVLNHALAKEVIHVSNQNHLSKRFVF